MFSISKTDEASDMHLLPKKKAPQGIHSSKVFCLNLPVLLFIDVFWFLPKLACIGMIKIKQAVPLKNKEGFTPQI